MAMRKSEHQMQVEAFMLRAKQEVPMVPTEPTEAVRILRAKLIMEEALETIRIGLGINVAAASYKGVVEIKEEDLRFFPSKDRPFSMVETVDGCCDVAVVTTGTLSACGVPDSMFQIAVNQNNLMKFGPGHSIRKDGKLIKPPGHQPPKIQMLLNSITPIQ